MEKPQAFWQCYNHWICWWSSFCWHFKGNILYFVCTGRILICNVAVPSSMHRAAAAKKWPSHTLHSSIYLLSYDDRNALCHWREDSTFEGLHSRIPALVHCEDLTNNFIFSRVLNTFFFLSRKLQRSMRKTSTSTSSIGSVMSSRTFKIRVLPVTMLLGLVRAFIKKSRKLGIKQTIKIQMSRNVSLQI